MTNEELFNCDRNALMSAWVEYGKIVGSYLDKSKGTSGESVAEQGGFARCPMLNPFDWLYKSSDGALVSDFEPGKLVVDGENRYGVILERRVGRCYNHMWNLDCILVDFRGTAGKVIVEVDMVKPAEFPKELVEFALGGKSEMKNKVHEKIEEAFNG